MTDVKKIARPYAKAAFEFANEKGQLSQWSAALRSLSLAVDNKQVKTILANPAVLPSQLLELFLGFAEKNTDIERFLQLLSENKRLFVLPAISTLFQELLAQTEGYLELTVTSAYSLDNAQQDSVKAKLEAQFKSAVKITYKDDASLIGGMLVRSNSWVLDDSVRGKLARLQSALS